MDAKAFAGGINPDIRRKMAFDAFAHARYKASRDLNGAESHLTSKLSRDSEPLEGMTYRAVAEAILGLHKDEYLSTRMETTDYQLRSDPKKSVTVPADYADKAEILVRLAMDHPERLAGAIDDHPYLCNAGVMNKTKALAESRSEERRSLKLQDEVSLRVCMYGLNIKKNISAEKEDALELDEDLREAIEDLSLK